LKANEVRVLATVIGKPRPESPITVSGWVVISILFLRIEKAAEMISVRGWTSCQEPSCWCRGKRRWNSVRNLWSPAGVSQNPCS